MNETIEVAKDDIILPKKKHEAEKNINSLVLFGKEKCGKTTALSQLDDCLIIDTEKGSKKVSALSLVVPEDLGPVGKMQWLKKVGRKLAAEGKPYKRVAIDTLSEVNEWSEWSGTYKYMMSPQGKSFNRIKDKYGNPIKGGELLDPDSEDYQSVHTIADGNGYRWSRDEMLDVIKIFMDAAECVIFVCHVEDKYVGAKDTTDLIIPKQLALTGKVREILPRKVDAIGYVYNEKGQLKVNFTGTEEKLGGARVDHLKSYNGLLDWTKIFI